MKALPYLAGNDFPFQEIKVIPPVLAKRGYRVWYWLTRNSFGCPIHLLLNSYWDKRAGSTLIHGLYLPPSYANHKDEDDRDLLILVTQTYKQAVQQDDLGLNSLELEALYNVILKIDCPHAREAAGWDPTWRHELFKITEDFFRNCILPKRDNNGKYYRAFNEINKYELVWLDEDYGVECPVCKNYGHLDHELRSLSKFPLQDGVVFHNIYCATCEAMIGIRIADPTYRE